MLRPLSCKLSPPHLLWRNDSIFLSDYILGILQKGADKSCRLKLSKRAKLAMERVKETRLSWNVHVEKAHDPDDNNANEQGDVWVISVCLHTNADRLYLCTGGDIR
jgi:hypothetical protein